jgi:sulfur-carrier protein adenylyltransferase/sulfurtransferase
MSFTPPPFSPDELARYSRQLALPGVGLEGQAKLRGARVLLVGLGGLGSPAALYLAAAGVGTLGLAETDRVELHNLHRQVLHDSTVVGSSKLSSARARLTDLNPHVILREHADGLTPANALALFSGYDVVLDGADNFPARYLASDAAAILGRPLVHGSIFQFEGQVTVFDPARGGPCYRCLFPTPPEPGSVPNCAEAGVFGALCGVIGSIMAMEALKLILGVGEPLRGRLLAYDGLAAAPRVVRLKPDPACPCCSAQPDARVAALDPKLYEISCPGGPPRRKAHDTNERFLRDLRALRGERVTRPMMPDGKNPPLEVDVQQARVWLESPAPPVVLDVREPYEVALCRLPGSLTIPLGQMHERLDALPRDRAILVHCHHGSRSLQAAKFLRAHGFSRATSLRGGIHDWAEQFDPKMPRY